MNRAPQAGAPTAESLDDGSQARSDGGARASEDAEQLLADESVVPARARRRWPYWLAVGVFVVGLLVTGALALISSSQYKNNEDRLLQLRARELGLLLESATANTQTPMASAAALANATGGNVHKFMQFVSPFIRPRPGAQFNSLSLWRLGDIARGPIAVVGTPPVLASMPVRARAVFARAATSHKLAVIGLTPPALTRLGFALTSTGPGSRFVVYGENGLAANRRSRLERNSAFSDLNYVLYLGPGVHASSLLLTSVPAPPITGRQARQEIPFGDTVLTLVVAPREPLSGTLPERLPWIIVIAGVLLSLGAAALTIRLIQGRRSAEQLAGRLEHAVAENQRLYAEQRTIAQTLQHSLLPDELPELPGAQASARYQPGERGIDVGGDWYDVIPLEDGRLLVVVGDVSGRGLRAATTMASLRFAIHAYAAENDPPETILAKLSKILSVTSSGQLATVLCTVIDIRSHELTIASAGHLPPLLISDGHGEFLESTVGLPVGVEEDATYTPLTVAAPPAATFLAYTDGLVERRGEALDDGLARLRDAATDNQATLPELLDRVLNEMHSGQSEDDTAIVGLRWLS